jgi:hypothetical protein
MFQVANRKANLNIQIVEILKVPDPDDPAKSRKLTTHCLIEMSNPVQLVVRLPRRDGGQVVEGLEVAAVPDVGPQPGQQAAALGQASQHLHLSGSPFGKCVAGLQQVLIHLKGRASGYLYRKKEKRSLREICSVPDPELIWIRFQTSQRIRIIETATAS